MIGVPMPSPRAVSISFQPSMPGQHHVEHEHVRPLVPQARETLLAVRHPERVETGGGELADDALADDLVVLDDQHLGHSAAIIFAGLRPPGSGVVKKGVRVVTDDDRVEAARGRALVEESREVVLVLDEAHRVVAASRRAREELPSVEPGEPVPEELLVGENALLVDYEVEGRRETLVYLGRPGRAARLRGAARRLHGRGVARAAHAARAPDGAARDGAAAGRGPARGDRAGDRRRSTRSAS